MESIEKVVPTICASHCGGTCILRVHVRDGIITKIETDNGEEPQLRACLKGRAYRQRVYAPDRLTFPQRRVGTRGEGKFTRITWDEALQTVSKELKRIGNLHGPESILYLYSAGDVCQLHNAQTIHKLLCLAGGYTRLWGARSFQGGITASLASYGTIRTNNSRDDLLNSRLIILWGWNPANTVTGTNTSWYLAQAKEAGAKVISVDPRFTDTAGFFADQWIPIRPGTDAAMLIAMAYVLLKKGLHDQSFLDRYTIGFEEFQEYVLGKEDGEAKTPSWAEEITGVRADTIEDLAVEYATNKPAALMAGIAPGRTAYGEQYHRAAIILASMTGNIGIHGGSAAGRAWESGLWYPYKMRHGLSFKPIGGCTPQEKAGKEDQATQYTPSGIHHVFMPEFVLEGKEGGYPADIKLLIMANANYVNQQPNTNKIIKALKKLEFIVILEQSMTASAKFADILLPTTTFLERNDINFGVGTPFYGFTKKVIKPVGECKSHLEIARELAVYMGIDYGQETEDELLRADVEGSEIPDYEKFKDKGIYRLKLGKPYVAFQKQIEDPAHNPFPTPSGKIEIYSQDWANLQRPEIPPVPKYIETWEGQNDPLAKRYPLHLITTHFKRRTHTQFDNIPWLKELEEQTMLINSVDAAARDIKDEDKVRVFNDRGELVIKVKVTERIMPGVVDIPQGAWYNPDEKGTDQGGNPNVLTRNQPSPTGAFPYNTCLVQVLKL